MATVSTDLILAVLAGVKTDFDIFFRDARAGAQWNAVATEIGTTLPTQNYAWLGGSAVMREYLDRVVKQEVRENDYTLSDKIYEATLAIERKAIEDDQTGMIRTRTQILAVEAARHWDELAFTQLNNSFTKTGYDGQYQSDSDHSEGASGTQSNTTSASLSDTSLKAGRAAMRSMKNDKGKPLNIVPNVLVVGPENEAKGEELLGSNVVVVRVGEGTAGSGATAATNFNNFNYGKYTLVVSPYLTPYNWHLIDGTKPVKPVIIQNRTDVPIELADDFSATDAKIKEEYLTRVRGRYVAGFGPWQLQYSSNASS